MKGFSALFLSILISSCSLLESKESRVKSFKKHLDWQIDKPYNEKLSDICKTHTCESLNNDMVSVVTNLDPETNCVIKRFIDTSKKSEYNPSKDIWVSYDGTLSGWEYISAPEQCQQHVNWWGPW